MSLETTYPGVYVEEIPSSPAKLIGVGTSIVCFIGRTYQGPLDDPQFLQSYDDFERVFGSDTEGSDTAIAVSLFFQNGGEYCWVTRLVNTRPPDAADYNDAFDAIDRKVELFNLLVLPKDNGVDAPPTQSFYGMASRYCQKRRAFLIMDSPDEWDAVPKISDPVVGMESIRGDLVRDSAAIYFPGVNITYADGSRKLTGAAGAIAGIMARTDRSRGIWKAPAGKEADIRGITDLAILVNDHDGEMLNSAGINTLRKFPNGILCWGDRTLDGDNRFSSEWKYIPVRRTALFIEESIYEGLKWIVSEPNNEQLWSKIRLLIGNFMGDLFRAGAFQGIKPEQAYFVKCDTETNTQNDIDNGLVNILVGFAPLKPAEFIIISLRQKARQSP